jgi:oligopeptidase A
MEELRGFARAELGMADVRAWDAAYASEKLRQKRYSFSDQEVKQYFPEDEVLAGMFRVVETIYSVKIRPGEAETWHPSVRFFEIGDATGARVGQFYLDLYARESKRGGAWMDDAINRRRLGNGVQTPVAFLTCNFSAPVGGKPALFTHNEVNTLFHEFGHGLHQLLTQVDELGVTGINGVEWDAVELPSQFRENWCYTRDTIDGLANHYATGEPLPRALFDKIVAARTYRAGSMTLRQIYFATLDLALHCGSLEGGVLPVQRRVAQENTVLAPLSEDRFLCSFSHILAGGYAAGYYSYKWAEVLSADAFGAFQEAGLERPEAVRETGRKFRRTVLSLGGSKHPMDVFREFRGRPPSTRPLLEQTGLLR